MKTTETLLRERGKPVQNIFTMVVVKKIVNILQFTMEKRGKMVKEYSIGSKRSKKSSRNPPVLF